MKDESARLGLPAFKVLGGAASLAGARAALTGDDATERRTALGIGPASTLVLLNTEGATANPASCQG